MSQPPRISKVTFNRNASPLGIGQARPFLSWRFEQDDSTETGWTQSAYELSFVRGNGKESKPVTIESTESVEVPWPANEPPLASREKVEVKVRAKGKSGEWTPVFNQPVEASLLQASDWSAKVIGSDIAPPINIAKRPFYVRKAFKLSSVGSSARIYATALGVYEVSVNGQRVGDHVMAPGWQSYNHRLHFQTYEVPSSLLKKGENVIEAVVGEGWYSGRLTWDEQTRNLWGKEIGVMIQLEVDGKAAVATGKDWEWAYGPMLSSELYDGETFDNTIVPSDWRPTKVLALPSKTSLIAPEAPPIQPTETIKPVELITTPSAKKIIDFGQNLVGWVKIGKIPASSKAGDCIILRFAEVMEKEELGVRPLRSAKAIDHIFLDEKKTLENWEPKFTTHGFRYCEVTGPKELLDDWKSNFTAIVVHSNMERLGDFTCSHEMVNQLHRNVVWGLRGNFVGLPTDCPQRDERLGWTGDLQAFAPTANFIYDTSGFLSNWLHDLSDEQIKDNQGVPPLVVPNTLKRGPDPKPFPQAVWGDVCVLTPQAMYMSYGSKAVLQEMWESMKTWLDKGIPREKSGLWENPRGGFQLSDWLDPRAPPDSPGDAMTDQYLVADAYLVGIAQVATKVAETLGLDSEAKRFAAEHAKLRKAFQDAYLAPSGRMSSDTQTAYALASQFDLLDKDHLPGAAERLLRLVNKGKFRIATGFAGTPAILHALTQVGHLQSAYRMLQEKGCPSWLYPISMGATTIWERWDSMLPDGSINPGEMTSFNHYALGAVANWLHETVAGLKPSQPGYKEFIVDPRPGGTLTTASAHTITPYGRAAVSWTLSGETLKVDIEVPPNTTAVLKFAGKDEVVGSGKHSKTVKYVAEGDWPPPFFDKAPGPPKNEVDTLAK